MAFGCSCGGRHIANTHSLLLASSRQRYLQRLIIYFIIIQTHKLTLWVSAATRSHRGRFKHICFSFCHENYGRHRYVAYMRFSGSHHRTKFVLDPKTEEIISVLWDIWHSLLGAVRDRTTRTNTRVHGTCELLGICMIAFGCAVWVDGSDNDEWRQWNGNKNKRAAHWVHYSFAVDDTDRPPIYGLMGRKQQIWINLYN